MGSGKDVTFGFEDLSLKPYEKFTALRCGDIFKR
jgi:hypothetical protein